MRTACLTLFDIIQLQMNVIILALWIELAGAQTSRLLRVNHMNNH